VRTLELTTARGKGRWGEREYEVELVTHAATYTSRSSTQQRVVSNFLVRFRLPGTSEFDGRGFDSEDARRLFLAKHFSALDLNATQGEREIERPDVLAELVGEQLSEVAFVMDYVQLVFDGRRITTYVWPVVHAAKEARIYDPGYRDSLCTFIAKSVTSVDEFLDAGLLIEFGESGSISVPLKADADFRLPEMVEYHGRENVWTVWQTGEPPYECA
jgi:hypothetical protein